MQEELTTKVVAKTEPWNLDPRILYFSTFFQKPNLKQELSRYTREAYGHKEERSHPQTAWEVEETVSIL